MLEFGCASPHKKMTLHYVIDELERYGESHMWKPHKERCIELSYACRILIKEGEFHTVLLLIYNELSFLNKGRFSLKGMDKFKRSEKLQHHLFQKIHCLREKYYLESIKKAPAKNFLNSSYSKILIKILLNINGLCPFDKFIQKHETTRLQCFLPEEIGYFKFLLESLLFDDCDDLVFYTALQCSYNLFSIRNYLISQNLKNEKISKNSKIHINGMDNNNIYRYMSETIRRRYRPEELQLRINLLNKKEIINDKIIHILTDKNDKNYISNIKTHLENFTNTLNDTEKK